MGRVRTGSCWGPVALVACFGLVGAEAWPLTGWRLFSNRRHPVITHFEARVVSAEGSEAPLPFAKLPHAYSGWVPVLDQMAEQAPAEREPACWAWAEASARVTAAPVAEVRVYRVTDDLRDGSRRAALAWTCGRGGR